MRPSRSRATAGAYLMPTFFLLLSASLSLLWSHVRLMWNDEFLSFYSDGVASFKQVILVQLHYPISLDPPTYHLLSHLCMDLLGRNAIALRLPALGGFLLFQLCLFFLVRRLAGERAAIVAMAAPLCTASFRYSLEGRPYGLLLGLYALSLLCWQIATQAPAEANSPKESSAGSRLLPLAGLTLSITLAITSHYFGVLILIPVTLGELSRSLIRRRIDAGVITALALGLASVGLILPFRAALMVYRRHYYITGVNLHDISQGYRELFLRYTTWPIPLQRMTAAILVILALTLAWAGWRRFQRRPANESVSIWVALASTALLPFFGYLFGRFVTHTMEVRYVIAALIAFAATFGMVLERRLRSSTFYYTVLALITAAALAINLHNIRSERKDSAALLAGLRPSPALAAALAAHPDEPLYEQSLGNFFVDSYYTPNHALRSRITLLYNADQEVLWLQHDTYSIAARNLRHFTRLPVVNYDQVIQQPGPHLLVQWRDGWNWTAEAFAAEDAIVSPLGPCFGGEALSVEWPQGAARNLAASGR
ncbi:MAG: glycosyltransferase family 39 protein [Acidobacteriaceae bacterium]